MPVAKPTWHNLKVYKEESPETSRPRIEGVGSLPETLKAFEQATGWSLRYVPGPAPSEPTGLKWSAPVNPGVGVAPGYFRLDPVGIDQDASIVTIDLEAAGGLASALAGMLSELARTRHALWQREAELAAGVPLVSNPDEQKHLAARLEAVLKGGVEAVGCQVAALYMLDEATTELKLRSSWGLPLDRLTDPARPLEGALADLEALLGHAVVLEDAAMMHHWRAPETFAAAVCVPVSSSTTILGTLWVFSTKKRDFTERQTNVIEVVAGRIAADLEREMLMHEGIDAAQLKRQVAAAERLQHNQLPTIPPLLDGWDLAGWTAQAEAVGGDFLDWFCLPEGLVAVAVGDAMDEGIEGALSATTLKAALRSHGQYHRQADRLLTRINLTLWRGSAGDQFAALFCGLIETAAGRIRYASAGQPSVIHLHGDGWQSLSQSFPPLGESPETSYRQREHQLQSGEALVIFTQGFRDAQDKEGRPLGEAGLAEALAGQVAQPADQLVILARDALESHAHAPQRHDRTVLVVKRTDS